MTIVKSFSVGEGDMFYIRHNSDNFSIIDCDLSEANATRIIDELKLQSRDKGITRFISTHPDEDHFGGIEVLDDRMPIHNFYVVKNKAIKASDTKSFKRYCSLRDGNQAFYISKGCTRLWMNQTDEVREGSGVHILWPDVDNQHFRNALAEAELGISFNNMSAVVRYQLADGASVLWLGDLETEFMESITNDIALTKTTIVFAAHHGRQSGRIPGDWLEKLDPQVIVLGEARSRHLNYYTGYQIITQTKAGDITFDCVDDKVHIYCSDLGYKRTRDQFRNESQNKFSGYIGSLTVETEYTL